MRRTSTFLGFPWVGFAFAAAIACAASIACGQSGHRSPVDLAVSPDGSWIATANQTSSSVSLVRVADGAVLDEIDVGERPAAIVVLGKGERLLVSCQYAGELAVIAVAGDKLSLEKRIAVNFEPLGVAASSDGKTAYAALSSLDCVAVVDLESGKIVERIVVGRQPRYLALSPSGERMVVGVAGERGVAIVDLAAKEVSHVDRFIGLNLGHVAISLDPATGDEKAYFPWMVYRRNPIGPTNIRLGWVLASRLARIPLEGKSRREAISLDPQGKAVADPHGIALSPDGGVVAVTSSGTGELLVFDNRQLPYKDAGSTDHIDPMLLADPARFTRIDLGGRPLGMRMASDGRTAFIANYLRDAVQVVDLQERKLVRELPLCESISPSLARQGEAIFFDAKKSLDQWYSCHSCHYEGGGNATVIDTNNDGGLFTFKTVLPLFNCDSTGPWTWHGWQQSLEDAVATSITSTMEGPDLTEQQVAAVVEYLKTLKLPPNPYRDEGGALSAAAERGKLVFESSAAGCATCHSGPYFTDGQIHDVGLEVSGDRYKGFNTPSLLGVHRKLELLHDGRTKTLEELLTGPHAPENVAGERALTEEERSDLVEYLRSL